MADTNIRTLENVEVEDVETLFSKRASEMHRKIDATRDAYFGFIFPITRSDFNSVAQVFNFSPETARVLYKKGKDLSTFKSPDSKFGELTNHIFGASILALRGKSLDTGLSSVNDKNIAEFVSKFEDVILEIADIRSSWFGRIFFPATGFSNAIAVFGGKVSPDGIYKLAEKYGYAALAGKRKTVRGDFGIGVWLALLGNAS